MTLHDPVLLHEVLEAFAPLKVETFFDGTTGAGGHAKALLEAHPEIGRYIACDRDQSALAIAKKTLEPFAKRVDFVHGAFAEMGEHLDALEIEALDGFLIDIGVSSMQLDEAERGFSFMKEAPLDMRMDPTQELTAEAIVNRYSEKDLADLFYEYGEERRSRKVAAAIVIARKKRPIRSTLELVKVIAPYATRGRLHPATLVFQALRIAVNDELGQLSKGLRAAIHRLRVGGRIAVITFHSLEDRIVKHTMKEAEELELLWKKPKVPSREEMRKNRRARSAKLRVGIKR